MKSGKPIDKDKKMEILMGSMLRYGVLVSALFVFSGGVVYLLQHGHEKPTYHLFSGEPRRYINVIRIFKNSFEGKARSIIQLGLLLLIATPIARIVFSIIGFILEKDYLYVTITAIVLVIIIVSLLY